MRKTTDRLVIFKRPHKKKKHIIFEIAYFVQIPVFLIVTGLICTHELRVEACCQFSTQECLQRIFDQEKAHNIS